jgi:hypothetical protein
MPSGGLELGVGVDCVGVCMVVPVEYTIVLLVVLLHKLERLLISDMYNGAALEANLTQVDI